jgi:DNA mismatch endonuclease Vsr
MIVTDKLTPEQRRKTMQAIRGKDTSIELKLRKELWRRGIHYRKNCKKVYGRPDIVFIGKKIAVFCDSEFWHGYDWENRKNKIQSNRDYWIPKIERNIDRDREVNDRLEAEGWTVLRFWGKDILKNTESCADSIEAQLRRSE